MMVELEIYFGAEPTRIGGQMECGLKGKEELRITCKILLARITVWLGEEDVGVEGGGY